MRGVCFGLTTVLLFCCIITQELYQVNSHPISDNTHHIVKRVKRQEQQPDPADQFFDNVFQIPISTLTAVNELIKSTRPVIRRARERIQQQYQNWQQQNNSRPNKPSRRSEE